MKILRSLYDKCTAKPLHRELLTGNLTSFSLKGLTFQNIVRFLRGLKSIRSSLLNMVEFGPGIRQIGPISGNTSTHHLYASHFQYIMPTTNLIKTLQNLPE